MQNPPESNFSSIRLNYNAVIIIPMLDNTLRQLE